MLALTLRQPWATAIAELGKDVENRTWAPPARVLGTRIAIHAGLSWDERGARRVTAISPIAYAFALSQQPAGVILATACVDAAVRESRSPWWEGPIGWVLSDVRRLRQPVQCRGAQGLWKLSDEVERLVLEREALPAGGDR